MTLEVGLEGQRTFGQGMEEEDRTGRGVSSLRGRRLLLVGPGEGRGEVQMVRLGEATSTVCMGSLGSEVVPLKAQEVCVRETSL